MSASKDLIRKIRALFGFYNLTEFEAQLLFELRQGLPDDWREILDSQLAEFNQTDRLVGRFRGELPPFGHTSFYKNVWGKSVRTFAKRFPSVKDTEVLGTLDVVDGDGVVIVVEFVLVGGVLFSIKYRSSAKRFVPIGNYVIKNFRMLI